MNLLCWNCRGLGNPWEVRRLRGWSLISNMSLVFVSETMISSTTAENLKSRLDFDSVIGVDSVGRSGGLCVYWKSERVDFTLVSFSQHHIYEIVIGENGVVWCFVGVHGRPEAS